MAEATIETTADAGDDDRAAPRVAIVGLGVVGGSLALALVARGVAVHGTDTSATERQLAAAAGVRVADTLATLAAVCPDVVLLAVPLGAIRPVCDALLPLLPRATTVLHAGGLQRATALALDDATHARVLGTHPLAGSHEAGFAAARGDLYAGATVWAEARADAVARERLAWLWRAAGVAAIVHRSAEEHDAEMAWVSHLPQLVATAVAATLAAEGVGAARGGPGLRDVTRLAASPLGLWHDVLRAAPPDTTTALAATLRTLGRLGDALAAGDDETLTELWTRAQRWRADAGPTT